MAVTVTTVFRNSFMLVADIIATADADAAAVVPHGLPNIPVVVQLTPMDTPAVNLAAQWTVGVVDITNVNLAKLVGAGSGSANVSARVTAMLAPTLWPAPSNNAG